LLLKILGSEFKDHVGLQVRLLDWVWLQVLLSGLCRWCSRSNPQMDYWDLKIVLNNVSKKFFAIGVCVFNGAQAANVAASYDHRLVGCCNELIVKVAWRILIEIVEAGVSFSQ